jgi:L-threonylcarbamoyladenylate synthase
VTEFAFLNGLSSSGTLRLSEVRKVSDLLNTGGLAVLPTETGYMLAAVATNEEALADAFAAKKRDTSKPMHVACSSLAMAERFAELTPEATRLLGQLTPGPITVVVRQSALLPTRLVTLNGTVGIRVPDHPATLQIIAEVGAPLTATSLNESGTAMYQVPDQDTLATLDWPEGQVVHVVDAGDVVRYPMPSTLIRLTGPEPEILRAGPIGADTINQILRPHRAIDVR